MLRIFYQIVFHFEAMKRKRSEYNRPLLVRLTYEYARSKESQDNFLRAFFKPMALSMDGEEQVNFTDKHLEADLHSALTGFAEYLFENFFLLAAATLAATSTPDEAQQVNYQLGQVVPAIRVREPP